jgi:YtkA-like
MQRACTIGSTVAEKLGAGDGQLAGSTLRQLGSPPPQAADIAASETVTTSSARSVCIRTSVPRPDRLRPACYRMTVVRAPWLLPVLAIAAAGGCGNGAAPVDAGDDGLTFATCLESHASKSVMPYAPGVTVPSSGGTYMATLVTSQPGYPDDHKPPGPEVKGVNTWNVLIGDSAGAPLDGLTVTVTPYMPDHRHGTSVAPVTTASGAGGYLVTPVYLYMSGYWEVTLDIEPPATDGGAAPRSESVMFNLCIP